MGFSLEVTLEKKVNLYSWNFFKNRGDYALSIFFYIEIKLI